MARIRTVKPELFAHEDLYDLERQSGLPLRLAFIGLLTCCDREGRFKWRPRTLKLDVLPYDDCDFEQVLNALAEGGFVHKYDVNGGLFGCIPTFLDHQVINQREAKSTLPRASDGVLIDCIAMHVHAHASHNARPSYEYKGVNIQPKQRQMVFDRDDHACVRCGATDDLTVDHIFPQPIGGTHAETNLRTLCRPCNSARPVQGAALEVDLAKDGLSMKDMQRMCMHVHAHGEGKGKEGKGKGRGKEGKEITVDRRGAPLDRDVIPTIFAYWQKVMSSPNSKLDARRVDLIRKALDLYEPRQLCEAILGCSRSPHHMGQNDRNTKYNGLSLILRNAEYIDKFIELASQAVVGAETIDQRNARIMAEFLQGPGTDDPNVIDMEDDDAEGG